MDPTLIQARITAAETALDSLMAGAREEEVRLPDGSSVRYTLANIDQLTKYIAWLKIQLCPRRPITFGFGR